MSSNSKPKSNLIFLFLNEEKSIIDCNKKYFEELLQLCIYKSANNNLIVRWNKDAYIFIDNSGIDCRLIIKIRDDLFYKCSCFKWDKNSHDVHELFAPKNEYIAEVLLLGFNASIFGEINKMLNEIFDTLSSNIENIEKTENQGSLRKIESKTKYELDKVYAKKIKVEVILDNIEFVIFDEHRRIIAKFGKIRKESEDILPRVVKLNGKISIIILRKTKSGSVLRSCRTDKNQFVLKIGTGVFHGTTDDKKFEWRVPHTAENVKHIEDCLINFNRWVEKKVKKEKKEEEEKQKIETERKKKEEEEEKKQKIETERKKKEEEVYLNLLQKENFIELK